MFCALKNMLGIRSASRSVECMVAPLFSGSAYFSNRVQKAIIEIWVAHGGEVSSGTTLDPRARYFFAEDTSEQWVTKLFAKSVTVIHAGWIVHCVDEAFRLPIAEYVLDDRFVPGPPYKLTSSAPPVYVPLFELGPSDTESGEPRPTLVRTSDTPSTPTNVPQKRNREQAYFDSPSRSLVFSGFDKDGMPRRPRKQRKLRFDPSFSPESGKSSSEAQRGTCLDWLRGHCDTSEDDDDFGEEYSQEIVASALHVSSDVIAVRSPDTPDKPLAQDEPSAKSRRPSVDELFLRPSLVSSQAISIPPIQVRNNDLREKLPPLRTIDFTNLPPPTRRWRFPDADPTNSRDTSMAISVVKPTDHKVKTPKKISFADHARVRVYTVSPLRPDAKEASGHTRECFAGGLEDAVEVDVKTRTLSEERERCDYSTPETIKALASRTNSTKIGNDPTRFFVWDQLKDDTLTLTIEEVQAMRQRLLESAGKDGVENSQLAVLFELGKTFRGMEFRHLW